jgi:hypothetical protein
MQIQAGPDIQTMDLIGPMLVAILFICYVDEALPRILEDAELPLSGSFRVLLAQLQLELGQLTARIEGTARNPKHRVDRAPVLGFPASGLNRNPTRL